MLANPLTSGQPDMGGAWYGPTDQSTSGSRIDPGHSLMDDYQLTGAAGDQTGVQIGSGRANVYVGGLVLFALVGMILFHLGGFDAHLYVGSRG